MEHPSQEKEIPYIPEIADTLLELFGLGTSPSNDVIVCLVDQAPPPEQRLEGDNDCSCR
jgi:hypothetical protein